MKSNPNSRFVVTALVVAAATIILGPASCAEQDDAFEGDPGTTAGSTGKDASYDVSDAKPDKANGGSSGASGKGGGGAGGSKGGAAGSSGKGGTGGTNKGGQSGAGGTSTGGGGGSGNTSGSSGSPMYATPAEGDVACGPGQVFIFGTCFP